MLRWIASFYKKHREIIVYMLFGLVTMVVTFAVYVPLHNWLYCSAAFSNAVSWLASVTVAYLTNKPFVFNSHDWSFRTILREFSKFAGCRFFTGFAETVVLFITADLISWDGNWLKIITSAFVVIANYVASKYFVFRHMPFHRGRKKKENE